MFAHVKKIGYSVDPPDGQLKWTPVKAKNNSLANTETNNSNLAMIKQEEQIVSEQEEILVFHEEGEVARDIVEHPFDEFQKLRDLDDKLTNDVIGFLQRPVHYADFEWLASAPDAVELVKEVSLPRSWLQAQMIQEKLQGFRYLKCDFKIRVQVNAQPFNAGYLLLMFIPLHE